MNYSIAYIKQLLRKEFEDSLTSEESRFLREVRPLFDEQEWQAMEIDVALDLPEKSTENESAKIDHFLKITEKKVGQQERGRRSSYEESSASSLLYWITGAAAVITVAIVTLIGKNSGDEDQKFFYADLQCAEVPLDEELPLSGFPVRVSWGDEEEIQIQAGATETVYRMGDIELRRKASGELQLTRLPVDDGEHPDDNQLASNDSTALKIRTAVMEQAEVVLPGGTRIRLNAGSYLSYRPRKNLFGGRSVEICIVGEALVLAPPVSQDPEGHDQPTLQLATLNAEIQTAGANFSVLSLPGRTMLTLLEGTLTARSIPNGRSYEVREFDKRFVLETFRKGGVPLPDRWRYRYLGQREVPAGWTRQVLSYDNMPIREFIGEMGRWYGFRINRIECIPADLRISVVVCRDTPMDDLLAVVRDAGVPIYQVDGVYTFCDPPGSGSNHNGMRTSREERSESLWRASAGVRIVTF